MHKPFEIGLVMAGAVSAGAYTGGVMDFLIQALDAWQKAKDAGEADAPRHEVRLKVMAGTSAGGMTAGIACGALGSDFAPVTDPFQPDPANKLFDSWVKRIDIAMLLGEADLADENRPVRSLLDSSPLDAIARDALDFKPRAEPRAWVSEPLHVLTTVSNLRGVPYNIPFRGDYREGHEMYAHADYVHFLVSVGGAATEASALSLDWARQTRIDNWRRLENAALATGAFPVGLAPRALKLERTLYDHRTWSIPAQGSPVGVGACSFIHTHRPIPAHWPESMRQHPDYATLCVDGGVMNNEPFDLARRIMLDGDCACPRGAENATRAIVMVDPFPGADTDVGKYEAKDDVISTFMSMFTAMKNQARFKPEDLALAQEDDVYSRFLIAPTRDDERHPIACGALGGFSGFLSEDFRRHDFMLGRRNCQAFLRKHFVLSAKHPLFANWSEEQRNRFETIEDGQAFLPIIPLLDTAESVCAVPEWPRYSGAQLDVLGEKIGNRYDTLMDRFAHQFAKDNWLARQALKLFANRKKNDAVNWACKRIQTEFKVFKLMR
ncbi:MAG: hypothetical protein B7Y41_04405 [Hydrogenophilales bacterium 28-61-23]|nr:MAG: hypothetical protein B7Y41_04405 [Hydrogenophilales bacterium 28-61-23]